MKLHRLCISTCLLLLISWQAKSQFRRLRETAKKFYTRNDTLRSPSMIIVPKFDSSPEKGFELGLGVMDNFYFDPKDKENLSSYYLASATYSTKRVFESQVRWSLWFPKNHYFSVGDLSYSYQPFYFYGIGIHTTEANKDLINSRNLKLNLELDKKIDGRYYMGLLVNYRNQDFWTSNSSGYFSQFDGVNKSGGQVMFIGLSQVFDSRNSSVYPTSGYLIKLGYSYAPRLFSNNAFEGALLNINMRDFQKISKKITFAGQATFQTIDGKTPPFYLMPTLGGDKVFRGYYIGRYQDINLALVETELRYRITQRIGIVGIAGLGTVYPMSILESTWKPSLGLGLRYFFDTEKGLALRLDYVVGEKKTGEDRQKGLYLSVGEAF